MKVSATTDLKTAIDSCPAPLGVFVHSSVYTILDDGFSSTPIELGSALRRGLDQYRANELGGTILASEVSNQITTPMATKFRLLVCGSAGVGKSTLVNLLLGVPNIVGDVMGRPECSVN